MLFACVIFVASGIEYAMCMRHICSLRYPVCYAHASYFHLWSGRLYNTFLHDLINGTIFDQKKVTEHKICNFIFSVSLYETFFTLRRTERDTINMYFGLHVKYQSFSTDFNVT
jgi:hypothetical protein